MGLVSPIQSVASVRAGAGVSLWWMEVGVRFVAHQCQRDGDNTIVSGDKGNSSSCSLASRQEFCFGLTPNVKDDSVACGLGSGDEVMCEWGLPGEQYNFETGLLRTLN